MDFDLQYQFPIGKGKLESGLPIDSNSFVSIPNRER